MMLRELYRLAWPVLVAQLAVMANGVADTMMAGRLSAEDLAAVGVGASVYITVFVTAMGVLLALSPVVAHHYGAGRREEIGADIRQAAWLAMFLAVAVVLLLRFPDPFLALSRLRPDVDAKVRDYLDAVSWSAAPMLMFRVFYGFSSGIGQPRPVMLLNLLGLLLKVPLNAVLMFGLLGAPRLGGPGCAVASAITGWLVFLAALWWCRRNPEYAPYGLFARFEAPSWMAMKPLVSLGLPIGATFLVDVTAFTFMALFVARLGPEVSGAHQIASNLAALAFMLPMALGNATGVLAGHALGAGDRPRARQAALAGLGVGFAMALVAAAAIALFSRQIVALYTPDATVGAIAGSLLLWVALYHVFDGVQAVAVNVLRGYKKATVPMVIYAVSLWGIGLGGGYVLGLTDLAGPARGAVGYWQAAGASLAMAGVLVTLYLLRISAYPSPAPARTTA
ncbi:MAG: MATE family efflux transporter [Rhodocyclaceae bacterium]|nr:MATE family efflux transporter [Rhodocyclaceae bacterium]